MTKDKIISELEKKYGVDRVNPSDLKVVTSGSISLDLATSIGGIPVGKMIEMFGMESGGKSTISLHAICEFQKAFPERKVALFDYEHSFDIKYARNIGVNCDELLIYQPDYMEIGYDLAIALVKSGKVSLIVIDTHTAAFPKAVIDGEIEDSTIGLQARINSKFCGKIKGLLDIHSCTLIMISQTRANVGYMSQGEISTGGNAIKFYSDMRWKVWRSNDKNNETTRVTVDVIKNKISKPFGQAKISILWGVGYDKVGEVIEFAGDFDIIKRSGSWYTIGDHKIHGIDSARQFMEENPEIFNEIYFKVKEKCDEIIFKKENNK
jgi:recombination protein RecA